MVRIIPFIALLGWFLAVLGCAPTAEDNAPFSRPKPYQFRNPEADFQVFAWSESKTPLIIGSYLRLKLRSTADGYVNLYAVTSDYKTRQLLANHPIRSGQTVTLDGPEGLVSYRLTPPEGKETYIAVVTTTPLNWLKPREIRNPQRQNPELSLNAKALTDRLRATLQTLNPTQWNAKVVERDVKWPRKPSVPKVL